MIKIYCQECENLDENLESDLENSERKQIDFENNFYKNYNIIAKYLETGEKEKIFSKKVIFFYIIAILITSPFDFKLSLSIFFVGVIVIIFFLDDLKLFFTKKGIENYSKELLITLNYENSEDKEFIIAILNDYLKKFILKDKVVIDKIKNFTVKTIVSDNFNSELYHSYLRKFIEDNLFVKARERYLLDGKKTKDF